jgi:predicted ATP-binding protein involved in virulence
VDYAASKSGKVDAAARQNYERVKAALLHVLPDVEDIRIEIEDVAPHVEVKTPYGWVPMQSLSLGYKSLTAWIVDLASRLFARYSHSDNPLTEPAIVLVDEIDLHLHPRWQRSLMSYLSGLFPNTQFIATAHSPLMVQAATDANIVVLRREGDHVVIDNDPAVVRNWRVDQILTSDLFGLERARPPRLDPLFAERERILGKSKLTRKDEARLKALAKEIGNLPTGETPADIEAMDIIRRAAAALQQK